MRNLITALFLLFASCLPAQLAILNCPNGGTADFCDLTTNSETHFNNGATDLCEGTANLSIEVSDSCPDFNPTVNYTLYLDLDHNGSLETVMNNSSPNAFAVVKTTNGSNTVANLQIPNDAVWGGQLPYGTHKMKWQVMSNCAGGSPATCSHFLYVHDCKKPTVVCYNGLSVNLMNTNPPMVQVWASEVLNYGSDNCTAAWDLKYRIRIAGTGTGVPQPSQTFVQFDCDDLGAQIVELWAGDDNQTPNDPTDDNWDFCTTYIIVQNNMGGGCDGGNPGSQICALYPGCNGSIKKVHWNFSTGHPALPPISFFDSLGTCVDLLSLPLTGSYSLTPTKDDDALNGVSTFDLILISKHILGISLLTSPYKWIAADVNKSNSITTFDIVELRKLILGIQPYFISNTSWRFVLEGHVFPPTSPTPLPFSPFWSFPQTVQMSVNPKKVNFIGIKIGDVNGSAKGCFAGKTASDDRGFAGVAHLTFPDRLVQAGEQVSVALALPGFAALAGSGLAGMQLALDFDPASLEFSSVEPGQLPDMSQENFGLPEVADGRLRVSWVDVTRNSGFGEESLFILTFKALQNGRLSQLLRLAENDLAAEAYGHDDSIWKIELQAEMAADSDEAGVSVFPNPAAGAVFVKSLDGLLEKIEVADLAGRVWIFKNSKNAAETLDLSGLPQGLYFLKCYTTKGLSVKKLAVAR